LSIPASIPFYFLSITEVSIEITGKFGHIVPGERVGEICGAGLGDGFGTSKAHPLIKVRGVCVADMRDEGHQEDQDEQ